MQHCSGGTALRRRSLLVGFALSLALLTVARPALAESPQPSASYDFRVDLNVEAGYFTAVQSVSYTNSTSDALQSIVFNVPASFFGGFALADVTVDGDAVRPILDKQSLELPLARALAPGQKTLVVLHYRQDLPPGDGRYGVAAGVVTLGDWYPMLAVYDQGWQRTPYSDIGDPFYTDVADYDVFLATSSPVTVVASGETISHDGKYWHFRARNARDFALAASARYSLLHRQANGVEVTFAYLPEHALGAAQSLAIMCDSLAWYGQAIGKYPFAVLSAAETVAQRPVHTAQEHSGLIFLRSDTVEGGGYYLDVLTAHEVAHQWFFGVVGNDQLYDPWLDEALVNSLALDFFRQRDGVEYQDMWDGWANYTLPGALNHSIYEFQKGTVYFDEVYRRGATFMRDLQAFMGAEAYWGALRQYYADHRFGRATPQDFLLTMRAASGADPMTLYRRIFDYAFLSAPDPHLTVTVPADVVAGQPLTVAVQVDGTGTRLRAALDDQPVAVANGSLRVGGAALGVGEHTLVVEALGPEVGYTRRRLTISAVQPAPTPAPQPAVEATPITVTPPAPAVPPAPRPVTEREAVWGFLAWLALALLTALAAASWRFREAL